ncbi:MAG: hypothetical protein ABEK12_03210, partial [Candidatus Nanohaloarchaea archaeon]
LVIRRYVQQNGADSLRPVYDRLRALNREIDSPISSTARANRRILDIMDTDLRPCEADTASSLRSCLETVNEMDPRIPPLGDLESQVDRVAIEPIPAPEPPRTGLRFGNRTVVSRRTVDAWIGRMGRLLAALVDRLATFI